MNICFSMYHQGCRCFGNNYPWNDYKNEFYGFHLVFINRSCCIVGARYAWCSFCGRFTTGFN